MTREEAIKCLKELPFLSLKSNSDWAVEKDINNQVAVRMAILALEQEPCEDVISRQAAIDIVKHECGEWKGLSKEIVKQFNRLPPVQPKPIECEDAISRKAILDCQYTIDESETLGISARNVVNVDDILNAKPVQPKQICEDTISRYGVPHKIAEFFSNWDGDEDAKMEISVNDMREIASTYQKKVRIEQQFKAIRQEPKVGRWIYERCDMYSCSVCHHWHTDLSGKKLYMNYCPNCGAKMIDPQESEDKG